MVKVDSTSAVCSSNYRLYETAINYGESEKPISCDRFEAVARRRQQIILTGDATNSATIFAKKFSYRANTVGQQFLDVKDIETA